MLDDIKKIIPKTNDDDFETIYDNIVNKQKKKSFNYKYLLGFVASFLLIAITIPLALTINSNNNEINSENESSIPSIIDDNKRHNTIFNETSLIGIAAYKEFDSNKTNEIRNVSFKSKELATLNNNSENEISEDDNLKFSYPYDYVKIVDAYKFSINVNEIEDSYANDIISTNCGLNEIEVVVANFETYVEEKETLYLSVQDTLISLRGENGYYTILDNSGQKIYKGFLHVFSSHKKLLDNEVSKDFTPPVLSIFLKESEDNRYVYFASSDDLLSPYDYNEKLAFKNTSEIEYVSRDYIYSLYEISKVPVKNVEVKIININLEKFYLEVLSEGENKLKYVTFNDHTEGTLISSLKVDDLIVVEYDDLYERYNPVSVIANKITLSENV